MRDARDVGELEPSGYSAWTDDPNDPHAEEMRRDDEEAAAYNAPILAMAAARLAARTPEEREADEQAEEAVRNNDAAVVAEGMTHVFGFPVPVQRPGGPWRTAEQHRAAAAQASARATVARALARSVPARVSCPASPRPRSFAPRRRSVRTRPAAARAPGRQSDDEPEPPDLDAAPALTPVQIFTSLLAGILRTAGRLDERTHRACVDIAIVMLAREAAKLLDVEERPS